jgi:putative transposase
MEVATDLKAISSAATEREAELNLELFAEKCDSLSPSKSLAWRADWARVVPLLAFPQDIGKVISTTNTIESVNMALRNVRRNHRIFPSDEAVYKVVYLAIPNMAVARGPCRSATGNLRSIGLLQNALADSRNDQNLFTQTS